LHLTSDLDYDEELPVSLTSLHLDFNKCAFQNLFDFSALNNLKRLQEFRMSYSEIYCNEFVEFLSAVPNLTSLHLEDIEFSVNQLRPCELNMVKKLTILPRKNDFFKVSSVLKSTPNLEWIHLREDDLEEAFLTLTCTDLPKLVYIDVKDGKTADMKTLQSLVESFPTLEKIEANGDMLWPFPPQVDLISDFHLNLEGISKRYENTAVPSAEPNSKKRKMR
jgi:hypothetical protein